MGAPGRAPLHTCVFAVAVQPRPAAVLPRPARACAPDLRVYAPRIRPAGSAWKPGVGTVGPAVVEHAPDRSVCWLLPGDHRASRV